LNFGRNKEDVLQQDGMMKTGLTGFFFGKRKRERGSARRLWLMSIEQPGLGALR